MRAFEAPVSRRQNEARTLVRLTDSDLDVLEHAVATDGGTSVAELESETGYATSTIYRALERLGGILKNENGNVAWISSKIAERVSEIVSVTEDVVEAAARQVENVLSVDPRDLERKGRAWQNWLDRYAARLVENGTPGDRPLLTIDAVLSAYRSGSGEYAADVVELGAIAWIQAGQRADEIASAVVEYRTADGVERARLSDLRKRSTFG